MKLLITSMGGGGSLNLVKTLRMFDTGNEFSVVGTHYDPYRLACSDLDSLYVVASTADPQRYLEEHLAIIRKEGVDILIANSDKEVAIFAEHLPEIPCKHLIPEGRLVDAVQDKFSLNGILAKHGNNSVKNVAIRSRDAVGEALAQLPECEKFWARTRGGSGSLAATWLYTEEQLVKWIDLWSELRGLKYEDFILAPFLPGRDFCVALLFDRGRFLMGKAYERLSYLMKGVSLSAMGSTPNVSRTVQEKTPIDVALRAVTSVYREFGEQPHGYYQLDLKGDAQGRDCVTEINIGRFPMTSPQFDRVGRYNMFQLYLELILDRGFAFPENYYDLAETVYICRATDMEPQFIDQRKLDSLKAV
jgi:hypothetical protein